jgi:hypothetical protein
VATGMNGEQECDWCGGDIAETGDRKPCRDRLGGVFCSKSHRDASTRAVRRLRQRCEEPRPAWGRGHRG